MKLFAITRKKADSVWQGLLKVLIMLQNYEEITVLKEKSMKFSKS